MLVLTYLCWYGLSILHLFNCKECFGHDSKVWIEMNFSFCHKPLFPNVDVSIFHIVYLVFYFW